MSTALALEEMQHDKAATERDLERLRAIVSNLGLFMQDNGGEDRRYLAVRLLEFEALEDHANEILSLINARIANAEPTTP